MKDAEEAMGITPVADLNAEREAIIDTIAELRARHSSFGTWDAERKVMLAKLRAVLFAEAVRDKRKVTNDRLDDEAHAHPDYAEFVKDASLERATLFRAEARIQSLDNIFNRGQVVGRFNTRLG